MTSLPTRRTWMLIGVAVAVLALVAAGVAGYVALVGQSDGPKITYPSAWDPAVKPYVDIVEKERDLTFFRPIHVDFLAEEKFKSRSPLTRRT